jgi:hypothetical protein
LFATHSAVTTSSGAFSSGSGSFWYSAKRASGCPDQGGADRFRLIDAECGAVLCYQCFSEDNAEFNAAVQWMRGLDFPHALPLIGEYLGIASQKRMKGIPDLCWTTGG